LPTFFTGRILGVDSAVADRWGRMLAAAGRPLPAIDSLLAATAFQHDLVLVTRNTRDFAGLPVQVFNPWTG
jgi:predicted nucleic acid-binding protein